MARTKSLAGRSIEQHSSPNGGGRMSDHRGVVLHIAQGTYRGTIGWQMNPNQRYASGERVTTSSTWIVGKNTGEWAQMVDTANIAWTQRDGSSTWLSIELAGFAPDKPTAWQIEACAQLLAWSARTYKHPIAVADHPGERGLGHHSMDREWLGEEWGHEACPGSGVIGAKAAIVKRAKEIEEDDDMPDAADVAKAVWNYRWDKLHKPDEEVSARFAVAFVHKYAVQLLDDVAQVRAAVAGMAGDDVMAGVREELARHRTVMVEQLATALGPALAEELREVAGEAPAQQLEAAVERALSRARLVVDEQPS